MRSLFIIIALLSVTETFSQKDLSGYYFLDGKTYNRDLTLLKIDSTHYKFWVAAIGRNFINTGDGILEMKKGYGIYRYIGASDSCGIIFKIYPGKIEMDVLSFHEEGCDWIFGSHVFGTYPFIKKGTMSRPEFQKLYIESPEYQVIAQKSDLFADSSCTVPKKQYFQKGDILNGSYYGPDATKSYYVEYLSPNNKFVAGWVVKRDLITIKE